MTHKYDEMPTDWRKVAHDGPAWLAVLLFGAAVWYTVLRLLRGLW